MLLLLEHPPVLTLGRNANRANILASDELLAARGVTLHEINRGGDVTYHGPGQLIGYPIFDLRSLRNASGGRLGPVDFVRLMEEALIRLCGEFGVPAGRICGLTGVWCGLPSRPADGSLLDESCGSNGQRAAARRASAKSPPSAFTWRAASPRTASPSTSPPICAISLSSIPAASPTVPSRAWKRKFADPRALPSLESIAHRAARQFGQVFNEQVLMLESLDALRAQAQSAARCRAGIAGP